MRGELIGINTAIVGPSGGNVGIGFAIPVDMARSIMEQLIQHGEVRRGILGVHIQDLTPDIATGLQTKAKKGAVVAQVGLGTPAAKAGVKAGDVIVGVNGKPLRNSSDLRNQVGLLHVDEMITLDIDRGGKQLSLTAKLSPRTVTKIAADKLDSRLAGADFGAIEQSHFLFGRAKGVEVLNVQQGSPAWRGGLRKGDIITSLNQKPITTPADLAAAAKMNKRPLLIRVRRGDAALFLALR